MPEVIVLYDGYSYETKENEMLANCTCTLVKNTKNIIIDTMTPWDSDKIKNGLQNNGLVVDDISYVISTHGHSDHIGNNNLFLKAKHIVGFCISFKDTYYLHAFNKGEEYIVDENIKVIPTPGHTLSDVTVLVHDTHETIAITGDLFERYEDIKDPKIWIEAGSEDPVQQRHNRFKVANKVDWIIPGHGPKFRVTSVMRDILNKQLKESS